MRDGAGWGGRREGSSVSPEPRIHRQKIGEVWKELKTEKLQSPEVGGPGMQEGRRVVVGGSGP